MSKKHGFRRASISSKKLKKELTMGGFSDPSVKDSYPRGLSKGWHGVDTIQTLGRFENQQKTTQAQLRAEAKKLSKIANARLRRLQNKGIHSPALDKWLNEGGRYFSVKGKSYNELQSELSRVRGFLNSKTSTIKGAESQLKKIASLIDRPFITQEQMYSESQAFFELASKAEQYLRNMSNSASAIGYQAIWEAINEYVEEQSIDLAEAGNSVNDMVEEVALLAESQQDTRIISSEIKKWNSLYL